MSEDQESDREDKTPADRKELSEDAIEQAKRAILFGVGYKRPPQDTRFKRGQSGNPKGRPRINDLGLANERSANAIALRECERLITVREGSDTREMPAIDAVFRKQIATALGGNAYAQRHATERYDRAELERRRRIADEIEIYSDYVKEQRAAIAEAKKKRQPLPDPLPHPDDVVLDRERGVQFVGPFTEDGRAVLDEIVQTRDALIMQDALDLRLARKTESAHLLDRPGSGLVLVHLINASLPERHRLSEIMIAMRMDRFSRWSKRKLLKEVYQTWRSLGARPPRGQTLGPVRYVKQKVAEMLEQLNCDGGETLARFIALPSHIQIDALGIGRRQRTEKS